MFRLVYPLANQAGYRLLSQLLRLLTSRLYGHPLYHHASRRRSHLRNHQGSLRRFRAVDLALYLRCSLVRNPLVNQVGSPPSNLHRYHPYNLLLSHLVLQAHNLRRSLLVNRLEFQLGSLR